LMMWYFFSFRKESTPHLKDQPKSKFLVWFQRTHWRWHGWLMFKFRIYFSETLEYLKSFANEIDILFVSKFKKFQNSENWNQIYQ
jgi:hypothetical protein